MKYTIDIYEEITNIGTQIENATIADLIQAFDKGGCVCIRISDENGKLVFSSYHEKLG